jgi:hypothetical protein
MLSDTKRKRIVTFGGDFNNISGTQSSVPEVYGYTASTDTWVMISPFCHGPGKVTPSEPNDGQPWVHDTLRDRYWALPGGWDFADAQTCSVSGGSPMPSVAGSTYYRGLMWMHADTGEWTGVTKAVQTGAFCGHYDPVKDCIVGISEDGSGPTVWRLFLSTLQVNEVPLTAGGTFANGNGFLPNSAARLDDFCIDAQGRKGYVLTPYPFYQNHEFHHVEHKLIGFDLDNPSVQSELASPPFNYPNHPVGFGSDGQCQIVFDTVNRKVLWPYKRDVCGIVYGMAAYDPQTGKWETFPVTVSDQSAAPVTGNAVVFDKANNVMLIAGGAFCSHNPVHYYLWRYA